MRSHCRPNVCVCLNVSLCMCHDLWFKIQVRHWPCGQVVSCVCAVAIREGDLILAADMCTDGVMHYLSNNRTLPIGASIQVFSGGYSFQVGDDIKLTSTQTLLTHSLLASTSLTLHLRLRCSDSRIISRKLYA